MCLQHILIASRPLPEVQDDPALPDLRVERIPSDIPVYLAHQRIDGTSFGYWVGPSQFCGCYFSYDDRADHEALLAGGDAGSPLQGEGREMAELIWQQGFRSISSFAHYLERHVRDTRLAFYVSWEGSPGSPVEQQYEVCPAFFGGPSFEPLPTNTLYAITEQGITQFAGTSAGTPPSAEVEYRAISLRADEGYNTGRIEELEAAGWEHVGPQGNGRVAFKRPVQALREAVARNELARWEGEWQSGSQALIIQGDRWRWGEAGKLTVEDLQDNRIQILKVGEVTSADLLVEEEPLQGQVCKAIFRLDGDTLWYSGDYHVRPTGFDDGSGYTVQWRRLKK